MRNTLGNDCLDGLYALMFFLDGEGLTQQRFSFFGGECQWRLDFLHDKCNHSSNLCAINDIRNNYETNKMAS